MEPRENQKGGFAKFMNKVYQIIILNIITFFTIIIGLGIFSLLPALVTLVAMLKNADDDTILGMIKLYFRTFKKIYWKASCVFIFFGVLIFLGAFSVFYFYCWLLESTNLGYVICYYVVLFTEAIFILALINACFMMVYYPHLKWIKVIKYAFQTMLVVAFRMILIFMLLIGSIYLGILFVFAVPLFSIALFMWIALKLLDEPYTKLIPEGYSTLNPYQCK